MNKKHIKVVYNDCFGGFSLSQKACTYLYNRGLDIPKDLNGNFFEYYINNIKRHDELLVECVEVLGEEASGSCANLQIKELYCSKYRIEDYDGCETIMTEDTEYNDWIIV